MNTAKNTQSQKYIQVNSDEAERNTRLSMKLMMASFVINAILAILGFIFIPINSFVEDVGRHGNGMGMLVLLFPPALSLFMFYNLKKSISADRRKGDDVKTRRSVSMFWNVFGAVFALAFVVAQFNFLFNFAEVSGLI